MQAQRGTAERSLGELFGELTRETSTLVRQEVALAKVELTQKATSVGKDLGFLAAGGAVAYAGFLALIAAVIYFLVEVVRWPLWVSAGIVGLLVAAIGAFLVWKGINALKNEDLTPHQTVRTLQEDAEWAKQQVQ
jgi:uncharacterized membrane protein YqjE